MGLFKGMRDVKKMSDHHGGMPSIKGAFKDIAALADDRGEGEILEKGTPAKAIVRGFPMNPPDDKFAMEIDMEVHPQQGEPYMVKYRYPTTRQLAAISPGMEVPIKVDPADPQRIAVQWEAQKAAIAAAGGDMAAVTQGLNQTYGGAADAAMRQAMANMEQGRAAGGAAPADDPTEKLKKLGELHASGVLTDAEFEAKKAELLKEI